MIVHILFYVASFIAGAITGGMVMRDFLARSLYRALNELKNTYRRKEV